MRQLHGYRQISIFQLFIPARFENPILLSNFAESLLALGQCAKPILQGCCDYVQIEINKTAKQMKKQHYVAPELEQMEISVEAGFAATGYTGEDDYPGWKNEEEEEI